MGVLVGFGGVAVLVGGAGVAGAGMALWGQAACLGGALAYAFAAVFGRRFRRMGLSPLQTATGQTAAASGVLIPLMLAVDRPWALALPGPETLAALVGVALLSTALAYILYFRILATAGAVNLLLVTLLIPATAILLGWAVLGEALAARHFIGMALIAGGLAIIDGRVFSAVRGRIPPRGSGRGQKATGGLYSPPDQTGMRNK